MTSSIPFQTCVVLRGRVGGVEQGGLSQAWWSLSQWEPGGRRQTVAMAMAMARKNNSPGIQVLSKTNIQFTYNPYYTTICRKAQPYLAPRIVMLLSLQVQVWHKTSNSNIKWKVGVQARERRGEQGRERRGEGEARRGRGEEREERERRGGGWGRESEGEAGGSVSGNQIEGEEGLYSESNSGRSVGEGGKFATTPSHYSK